MSQSCDYDVLIVGAGAAGMAAAHYLEKHGLSVCVLESRSRVGGRAFTSTELGVPIDLGASWMHHYDERHPFYQVAKEKGIGLGGGAELHKFVELTGTSSLSRPPTGGFRLFDVDGSIVEKETLEKVRKIHQDLMAYADTIASQLKRTSGEISSENQLIDEHIREDDDDDVAIYDTWIDKTRLNDMSVAEALEKERTRLSSTLTSREQRILNYFLSGEEQYEAATMQEMSVKHWCAGDGDVQCDMFVQRGYGVLVADMAHGLNIKLETRVTNISYTSQHVTVTTVSCPHTIHSATNPLSSSSTTSAIARPTSQQHIYTSKYVLVTVPLGVLKKRVIEFSPPLPKWKTDVIDRMGWGLMNKIVMQFPTPFWGDLASIGYANHQHGLYRWFLSLREPLSASSSSHPHNNNNNNNNNNPHNDILICFITARNAWDAEMNKNDAELIDDCMKILRLMFEKRNSSTSTSTSSSSSSTTTSTSSQDMEENKYVDVKDETFKNAPVDDTIRGTDEEEPSSSPHSRHPTIPSPTAYLVTRWGQDPHAYGSYSFFATKSHPNDCFLLAKHIDHTVYFAGEATYRHTIGCVDSAYFAGELQAKRIVKHAQTKIAKL